VKGCGLAEKDFTFQHLESDEDVEQHLELMRKVFGQNARIDLQIKKWIDYHPAMTLKDFLVIKHHGKIVACLNIIPSKWSIGGIELKVSELGCVATMPEYRHQGLQKWLHDEYHKQLLEQQYDLSAIEGIPYFYRQFGYEYVLPLLEQTVIRLEKLPDYRVSHEIRPFSSRDISRADQLLRKTQEKFYVHSVRDEGVWKMQQETRMVAEYEFEGYAVEVKEGMIAYFRTSYNTEEKQLLLREITDVDQACARSILGFLKDVGAQHSLETLAATISCQESFTEHMVAVGGTKSARPYAWQLRIMDYVKLFSKMKPLFEQRLAQSTYRDLTETVNFNFYRFTIQMTLEDGVITNVRYLDTGEERAIRSSPLVFTQLLFGFRSREELETIYPDFTIRPSHKYLVDVLLPKMPSYIHTEY
jgi:predicted acetyltransferase